MYINWNLDVVFKTVGQILYYSSFSFLLPALFSILFREPIFVSLLYVIIFAILFLTSIIWRRITTKSKISRFNLRLIHALIIVCIVWIIYAAFSALPFTLIGKYTFLDSYFETISALTTTGLTIFPSLPIYKSLILWRSLLSWIGGVGIVLLAYFGVTNAVFAKRLFEAEGHDRIRPNFKKTIKDIWLIYFVLTIIGVILLMVFGMNLFDAINYSMSAISTTGMDSSTLGAQMFTPAIQLVLTLIMILGSISFILHYTFFRKRSFLEYVKDKQLQIMLLLLAIGSTIVIFKSNLSWISSIFNIVSAATCGGFTNLSTLQLLGLGPFVLMIFVILMIIGGCTNSTTGGIKVDRFVIFIKSIFWKIKSIILPSIANIPKKHNGESIDDSTISTVNFFILIYILFILLGVLVLSYYNYPLDASIFEVVSAQGNVGISAGIVEPGMPVLAEIMLIINMWIGRLEIIPILGLIGMLFQRKH